MNPRPKRPVAELEAQIPAMLHRLKPAALRAAAAPLGVAARPIKTRADKAARLERDEDAPGLCADEAPLHSG